MAQLLITRTWKNDSIEGTDRVYQGDLPVNKKEKDQLDALLGDPESSGFAKANVSVGRTITETIYGRGGTTFINVNLACKQNTAFVDRAIEFASEMVDRHLGDVHESTRAVMKEKGIMDEEGAIR